MTIPDPGRDDPPSATERVAKLRLKLNSYTTAELVERGIVVWDENENLIRAGPKFDAKAEEVLLDNYP